MSNFAALFTIACVVLLVLVLVWAACKGVAWLWRKAFGPDDSDFY